MNLNRQLFWQGYHKYFEVGAKTTQATVDALNAILDKFETETRLKNVAQFAYVLATAFHESGINGNHFVPVKEGKARVGSKIWEKYQKRYWNTGYYGRGLVQTTWEEKYLAVGTLLGVGNLFVENPDLLLDINWAYEALVAGMVFGIYRKDKSGKKYTLQRFLKTDDESTKHYTDGREIVNGDGATNGALIAGYAQHFETVLLNSRIKDSAAVPATIQPAGSPSENDSDLPATAETERDLSANQPPDNTTGEIKETITEKTQEDGKEIEKTTTQTTDIFNPANIPAFIPRFGKQWFLGLIPGGGLLATLTAKLAAMPDWLVFTLGVFTGVTIALFFQLIIKHREKVVEFITKCYEITADPTKNNLIPTPAGESVGFFQSYGVRRSELLSALSKHSE